MSHSAPPAQSQSNADGPDTLPTHSQAINYSTLAATAAAVAASNNAAAAAVAAAAAAAKSGSGPGSSASPNAGHLHSVDHHHSNSPTGLSSTETLLRNIQSLLTVAADNARQQERQINYEKGE